MVSKTSKASMRPDVEKAPKSKKQKTEVQKMDDNTYLVSGSTGTIYEVTRDEQVSSGWFCRSTTKNDACMGWKFSKEHACKHVKAVMEKSK